MIPHIFQNSTIRRIIAIQCLLFSAIFMMINSANSDIIKNRRRYQIPYSKQNFVIFDYDSDIFVDNVFVGSIDGGEISITKKFRIKEILPQDRCLRYITKDDMLNYVATKTDSMGFKSSKDLIFNNLPDKYLISRNLVSNKERRIELLTNYKIINYNSYTPHCDYFEYFQSSNNNEIIALSHRRFLGFSIIDLGNMKEKNYFSIKNFQESHNSPSVFNPMISPDGKRIAFSTLNLQGLFMRYQLLRQRRLDQLPNNKNDNTQANAEQNYNKHLSDNGWYIYLIGNSKNTKPVELALDHFNLNAMRRGNNFPIPHKCWSPDSKNIIFMEEAEVPGIARLQLINIEKNLSEVIAEFNNSPDDSNPSLEWSDHGILLTMKESIFFIKQANIHHFLENTPEEFKRFFEPVDENVLVINILKVFRIMIKPFLKYISGPKFRITRLGVPENIKDINYGRFSPSGNQILFFGKKDNLRYLFIYSLRTGDIVGYCLGKGKIDDLQGGWIYKHKTSTIKNEADYGYFFKNYE